VVVSVVLARRPFRRDAKRGAGDTIGDTATARVSGISSEDVGKTRWSAGALDQPAGDAVESRPDGRTKGTTPRHRDRTAARRRPGGHPGSHPPAGLGRTGIAPVRGTIRLGDERWDVDGYGVRDRSWGPRMWQAPSGSAAKAPGSKAVENGCFINWFSMTSALNWRWAARWAGQLDPGRSCPSKARDAVILEATRRDDDWS
jgi:hypothetical protein